MKYRIVLFNGAIGIGKSWVCKELMKWRNGVSIGLNDGLKEVMCHVTGLDLWDEQTYAEFKTTRFENGRTGREWMINVSESSKEYNPTIWVERFADRVRRLSRRNRLIFCDSFGFPIEYQALMSIDDFDFLRVYIGAERTEEGEYRRFENDSRYDLSRHCTIKAHDSNAALAAVQITLENRGWV